MAQNDGSFPGKNNTMRWFRRTLWRYFLWVTSKIFSQIYTSPLSLVHLFFFFSFVGSDVEEIESM